MVPLEGGGHAPAEPRPPGVPGVLRGARRRARPRRWRTCCGWPSRTGRRASARDMRGRGQVLVLHRADRVRQRRAPARHRAPQGRSRRRRRRRRLPAGRRARERLLAPQRVLRDRGGVRLRGRGRAARGVQGASSTPASSLQVDDAVLLHEYDSILSLGGSVDDYRRWAELRVEALNHALSGIPEDRDPLPRLLRELARPARLRPAARRRDRPRPAGAGPLLPDRAGERRATSTSGGSGRTSSSRRGRSSSRASSPTTRTSSSTPSSSPSGSCGSRSSSAART